MMKDLIVITDNYPFGNGEPFLENEIKYLSENFRKIYIISKNQNDMQTREIPKNCKVYRIKKDLKKLIGLYLDKLYLLDLFKEFKLNKLKKLVSFQFYGKLIENKVKEVMKENNLKQENILFYSYWFYSGAYAGSILKRKNKINKFITRAHRYDLYLEENYQPFKTIILKELNSLYSCSEEGKKYLQEKYFKYTNKIKYSYLGTINKNELNLDKKENIIISCSYLVKVKRVELIIEALSKIKNSNVIWYHLGSGILEDKIKNLAKEKLKNITYSFVGHIKNKEVIKFYKENKIKVLINLSSSEGVPVSMMEAQSFGVPIIATDVGGVSEIVNERTGILLSTNPKIEEIVEAIEKMINLDEIKYDEYRKNSYLNWKKNFDAEKNYKMFIENIYKL